MGVVTFPAKLRFVGFSASLLRVLDVSDIDELAARVRVDSSDMYYDLDDDREVTKMDTAVWVEVLIGTLFGDADLNGRVEFADYIGRSLRTLGE